MHFIGKTTFTLRIGASPSDACNLQQQVLRVWEQEVLPALDAAFSGLAGENEIIHLDRLEVDVAGLHPGNWQQELARRLTQAVSEAIEKQLSGTTASSSPSRRVSKTFSHFEAWLHFLERGYLPLTGKSVAEKAMQVAVLETVAAHVGAKQSLLQLLRREEKAMQRLLWQHPEKFLQSLAEAVTGRSQQQALALKKELETLLSHSPGQTKASYSSQTIVEKSAAQAPSAALKNTWISLREKWAAAFYETLWNDFILPDKAFEPTAFTHAAFTKTLTTKDLQILTPALVQTAGARPAQFSAVLPGLQKLLESIKTANPGPAESVTSSQQGQALLKDNPAEHSGKTDALPQAAADRPENKRTPTQPEPAVAKGKQEDKSAPDTPRNPSEATHWYISNAGVVLLHPYLPILFKSLGLTDGPKFKNKAAQHRAVYLLHYLATGSFAAPEYDLIFQKHLCGIPAETPLRPMTKQSKSQQKKAIQETSEMLQAIINHWSKLGDTSPDGLRSGFLSRAGKLSFTPTDGWKLKMEQSGIDILLGFLPWGLGMVKTPWMQDFLHVEWSE